MAKLAKSSITIDVDYSKESFEQIITKEERKLERICNIVKKAAAITGQDPNLCGKILRFAAGDGYAQYMVTKSDPLTIQHISFGDAYQIPYAHVKGLDLNDVRFEVERTAKIKEIFSR